jgi:hypothetical protein
MLVQPRCPGCMARGQEFYFRQTVRCLAGCPEGAQTKRPETKHPETKRPWTKRPWGQNVRSDKTSVGQNIRGDKRSVGQKVRRTKRPWGQNVLGDKTSVDKTSVWVIFTRANT